MTTYNKTHVIAACAATAVTAAGFGWAATSSLQEPEVVHETHTKTSTSTTTEPKLVTKTKSRTVTETMPPRTVTETQAARSPERQPVPSAPATGSSSPAENTPAPTSTSAPSVNQNVSGGGIASCIAKYESGGNPKAENPSGASGLYQFMPGTWKAVTGLNPPASAYSVETQTQAFHKLWNGGAGSYHWVTANKCL